MLFSHLILCECGLSGSCMGPQTAFLLCASANNIVLPGWSAWVSQQSLKWWENVLVLCCWACVDKWQLFILSGFFILHWRTEQGWGLKYLWSCFNSIFIPRSTASLKQHRRSRPTHDQALEYNLSCQHFGWVIVYCLLLFDLLLF